MAVLTTGNTFSNGDQVTASSLNNAVNNAEFAAGAVDGISTQLSGTNPQQIIVKDLGISRGKIAIDAVGTDQLANDVVVNTSGSITGAAGSFTTLSASGDVNFDSNTLFVDASTNNVGIGSSAPDKRLVVAGVGSEIVIDDTDATDTPRLRFRESGTTSGGVSTDAGELIFDSGTTERVRIDSSGNVGIGTPSPGRLLTVAGDAEFNVVGSSNTSKGIVINSSGTNFESDDGIIQATHAGSGSLTGGYWLKFNANSADKFTVRGDGRTEISSTTGGVILPRMSTSNRTSISSPANGEMVYDTDLNKFYGYANGAWVALH